MMDKPVIHRLTTMPGTVFGLILCGAERTPKSKTAMARGLVTCPDCISKGNGLRFEARAKSARLIPGT